MAVFLIVLVVMRLTGRQADMIELVATGMGGLTIIGAVLQYISFRYSVRDGALHLSSGIIQKQNRTIPIERIQNINLKQDLIHRLMGVADVRIETASGGDAEAVLSVLSVADAQAIREALASRAEGAGTEAAAPEAETVYRASLGHLALAGATQNRLGTLLGGVLGILFYFHSLSGNQPGAIQTGLLRLSQRFELPGWTGIALIVLGLIFVGWIASMVLTIVSRYGFELTRAQGQLQRTFGLLTKHQSVFPVARVQILRITAPLLQRVAGLCRISAETAGSFRENDQQSSGTNELCPIIKRSRAGEMSRLVLQEFHLETVQLLSIHRLGWRRAFMRSLMSWLFLFSLGSLAAMRVAGPHVFWSLALTPLVAWVYATLYFRATRYALHDRYLVVQSGIWTRTLEVVPVWKVQASFVRQSPLQRRLGLATLRILTAGTGLGGSVSIRDLGLQTAVELQDHTAAL